MIMKKVPFVTNEQLKSILEKYPTPFHLYDEKGIRENAKAMYDAFSWNKGFREYFAVKAEPNPFVIEIMQKEGCGFELARVLPHHRLRISSWLTSWEPSSIWTISLISIFWKRLWAICRKRSVAVTIPAEFSV